MQWSAFRDLIRRTFLSDQVITVLDPDTEEATDPNWSNDVLLDALRLALDGFAQHTARQTTAVFDQTTIKSGIIPYDMTVDREFVLINPPIDFEFEESAIVILVNDGSEERLSAIDYTPGVTLGEQGYFLKSDNVLQIFAEDIKPNARLYVTYFAYYPIPVVDTDLITVPRWAFTALCYLMAAHAMVKASVASAQINQWKVKQDSGNPEHNAFRAQQKWLIEMYERELARYPRQKGRM